MTLHFPPLCYNSYASYNLSAPRLPKGLVFSSSTRPVTYLAFQEGPYVSIVDNKTFATYWNLGNSSYDGLR